MFEIAALEPNEDPAIARPRRQAPRHPLQEARQTAPIDTVPRTQGGSPLYRKVCSADAGMHRRLQSIQSNRRHAPSKVIPFVVSAGGGVTEATDKMFPAPTGRNGRHYQRQHVSGVLVTFRQQLAAEFASRNCAYTAAGPATA